MRTKNLGLLVPSLVLLALACNPPTETPPPPPPAPVASVAVSPGTPSILVGTAVQLSAATKDAQGSTLSGRAITWSSSAEAVATVNATGLVTGVSAGGPVTITATSEGQLGSAQIWVTAPSLTPDYALTLSSPMLSAAQGAWSPITTVDLVRSNFTGNVSLRVENLPTGVGVSFGSASQTFGNSAELSLSVAPNALPGTYTNLLVRGVASGLADRTAPLTLTITVAPFVLTLSSSTLSIAQGTATQTTTVNVVRNNFAGPVTLFVNDDGEGTLDELTTAFAPNPTAGNSSVLSITVSAAKEPGVYELVIYGNASTGPFGPIRLTLTVTAASP